MKAVSAVEIAVDLELHALLDVVVEQSTPVCCIISYYHGDKINLSGVYCIIGHKLTKDMIILITCYNYMHVCLYNLHI